jgi:predicted O-linked N-acetylglucosamine transferase (SPINDLY family)
LFESLSKIEKGNLSSKLRISYSGSKLQKIILVFICSICFKCLDKGFSLGTYYIGLSPCGNDSKVLETVSHEMIMNTRMDSNNSLAEKPEELVSCISQ